jgi:transposase
VDANGNPVRVIITKGTEADCKQAIPLIDGISAGALLADRAYDTNEIVEFALQNKMQVIIPPKKNRIEQREYDEFIYKIRHLVENAILWLKRWRGIATRYAKTVASFRGAVVCGCIVHWLRLLV